MFLVKEKCNAALEFGKTRYLKGTVCNFAHFFLNHYILSLTSFKTYMTRTVGSEQQWNELWNCPFKRQHQDAYIRLRVLYVIPKAALYFLKQSKSVSTAWSGHSFILNVLIVLDKAKCEKVS